MLISIYKDCYAFQTVDDSSKDKEKKVILLTRKVVKGITKKILKKGG